VCLLASQILPAAAYASRCQQQQDARKLTRHRRALDASQILGKRYRNTITSQFKKQKIKQH